jgi:hypothetical protein
MGRLGRQDEDPLEPAGPEDPAVEAAAAVEVVLFGPDPFAVVLFVVVFLAADFLAVAVFDAVVRAVAFFAVAFFPVAFLAVDFFAVDFFAVDFFAVAFFADVFDDVLRLAVAFAGDRRLADFADPPPVAPPALPSPTGSFSS